MTKAERSGNAVLTAMGCVKGAMHIMESVPKDIDLATTVGDLVVTVADRNRLQRLTLELSAKAMEVAGLLATIQTNQPPGD